MWRYLCAAGLAVAVFAVTSAEAQPPAAKQQAKEDVKALEAQLAKLRDQVKEVEGRLQKAKEAAEKQPPGRGGPRRGFGPPGFGKGKFDKGKFGKRGPGKFGKGKFGKGPRPAETDRQAELEKRIDRLAKELEELRREVRRK